MMTATHEEHMRVTSIPFRSTKLVIFTGVPLVKGSYRINSGKYFVTIKADPEHLPAPPALGQHWSVKGVREVGKVQSGDYLMEQHTYQLLERVECTLPDDGEQLIKFIAKEQDFKGIGESKARELWQLLGSDFHATLRNDTPESRQRLRTVLSENSVDALYKGYGKYANLRHCNWMNQRQIPASVQQRLLKYHGEKAIDTIQANPYILMGFGMEFDEIEGIIKGGHFNQPIAPDDLRRLSAALEMAIRKEVAKGHTYTTKARLRPHLDKLLNNAQLVSQAFQSGHDTAQYFLHPETGTYHPKGQFFMESVVTKRLNKLVQRNDQYDEQANAAYCAAVAELPYQLTAKQSEAVMTCLDNSVSCITGGAGTGKTTVLRTALRAYHQQGYEIHAVALSGRAAMRLHESIGFSTCTIAKLLRSKPVIPDGERDKHLLVVDEASMIDLPTMYSLVTHTHPSVKWILVGDPDQLPPIGCGKVLADIVEAKTAPNTKLDIVKRQEGSTGIPEYSRLINQGVMPDQLSTGTILFHQTSRTDIARVCCELYQQSPENSCIMAPTKALVSDINKRVQQAVNPTGDALEFTINGDNFYLPLRENDAVLFTQNLYAHGIQNGTLGTLTSAKSTDSSYGEVTLDTGEKVAINQSVLDCMELGYAITLHKAQGSQFPRVIIALQKGKVVDRAWLYTAITRAEHEIHIVGSAEQMKQITEAPSHANNRNSYLKEMLRITGS